MMWAQASCHAVGTVSRTEKGLLGPLGQSVLVINQADKIWGEAGAVGTAGDAALAHTPLMLCVVG